MTGVSGRDEAGLSCEPYELSLGAGGVKSGRSTGRLCVLVSQAEHLSNE